MSHGLNVSLRSFDRPDHFVTHQNWFGRLRKQEDSDLFSTDASFRLVKGFADPVCISFEAVLPERWYLRHQNYRIALHKHDGTELFSRDATFIVRPGLANSLLNSFECFAPRNHFLCEVDGTMMVKVFENTEKFRRAATFSVDRPLALSASKQHFMSYNPVPPQHVLDACVPKPLGEVVQEMKCTEVAVQTPVHERESSQHSADVELINLRDSVGQVVIPDNASTLSVDASVSASEASELMGDNISLVTDDGQLEDFDSMCASLVAVDHVLLDDDTLVVQTSVPVVDEGRADEDAEEEEIDDCVMVCSHTHLMLPE